MADIHRSNRVRELLQQGKIVIGGRSFTNHPAFVEIMGWSGFDFVVIDTEHAPTDVGETVKCIRACEITGVTPIVRVSENNPSLICKALDNGAQGVIVPHISTSSQAEAVVHSVKFLPLGDRSACPFTRQAHFGLLRWSQQELREHYQKTNEDTLVMLLVEGVEGVKNLPDILKVKGVDIICFGAGDFSHSIGEPGATYDHPKMYGALKDVAKMCSEAGVAVLTHMAKTLSISEVSYAKKVVDAGVRVIYLHSDLSLFTSACREMIKIRDLL
jgi:4-hydroxy-2-oxoheptanedioate aldolase